MDRRSLRRQRALLDMGNRPLHTDCQLHLAIDCQHRTNLAMSRLHQSLDQRSQGPTQYADWMRRAMNSSKSWEELWLGQIRVAYS